MPADARLFLKRGSLTGKPAELWMPFAFTEANRTPRGRYMSAIARLKPGVELTEAQAQMDTIASGLTEEFPQFDTGWGALLVPMHRELSGRSASRAARAHRRGRLRAADRVRERREPAARARRDASARDRDSQRARRRRESASSASC